MNAAAVLLMIQGLRMAIEMAVGLWEKFQQTDELTDEQRKLYREEMVKVFTVTSRWQIPPK